MYFKSYLEAIQARVLILVNIPPQDIKKGIFICIYLITEMSHQLILFVNFIDEAPKPRLLVNKPWKKPPLPLSPPYVEEVDIYEPTYPDWYYKVPHLVPFGKVDYPQFKKVLGGAKPIEPATKATGVRDLNNESKKFKGDISLIKKP